MLLVGISVRCQVKEAAEGQIRFSTRAVTHCRRLLQRKIERGQEITTDEQNLGIVGALSIHRVAHRIETPKQYRKWRSLSSAEEIKSASGLSKTIGGIIRRNRSKATQDARGRQALKQGDEGLVRGVYDDAPLRVPYADSLYFIGWNGNERFAGDCGLRGITMSLLLRKAIVVGGENEAAGEKSEQEVELHTKAMYSAPSDCELAGGQSNVGEIRREPLL